MRVIAAASLVAVLTLLTGCSVRNTGTALPPPSTTTSSATAVAPNPLPPRQRELDLTGLDPCKDLLTFQQLKELEYDLGYVREPVPDHSDIHGGPDCTFASDGLGDAPDRNMGTLVGISTTESAEKWATDPARAPAEPPEVVTIEGFAALVLPHERFVDECMVVVDTAENQYLEVSAGQTQGEGTSPEPFCAEAQRVATMAIQTISESS